jgi:hypothetical protein
LSERKYEDSLKRTAILTEKFAKGAAKDFALVGGAFVAAASGVVAGGIALATSVANQDIGYQLLARRMFMTTDAVRKMDFATKALGLTLPEIIFGPVEVQERYHVLIQDETKMLELLGGDQGESAFRRIRDIQFQFTRLEPALKIFAMRLTEDVMNKLFGGSETLEGRMRDFVNWFESPEGFVRISDNIANVLVPAIKAAGAAMGWLWDSAKGVAGFIKGWGQNTGVGGYDRAYERSHIRGGMGAFPPPGSDQTGIQDVISSSPGAVKFQNFMSGLMGPLDPNYVRQLIASTARNYGLDPNALLAEAMKESGGYWMRGMSVPRGAAGEYGVMQVMPATGAGEGFSESDLSQLDMNIAAGAIRLKQGVDKYGYTPKAFQFYNPNSKGYGDDVYGKYLEQKRLGGAGATMQPQAYHPSAPAVNVYVTQTSATTEHIRRAVRDGIDESQRRAAANMYANAQGSYA